MRLTANQLAKLIGAGVAIAGVIGSAVTFAYSAWTDVETRRRNARAPFLERQLATYLEATRVASKLATNNRGSQIFVANERRFWELYWGELSLVEDWHVESAMVAMGHCLRGDCTRCHQGTLEQCALRLAHACRKSLGISWGVKDWLYTGEEPTHGTLPPMKLVPGRAGG
jgi:hypothetical protein